MGKRLADNFDFDIQYLGVDGLSEWLSTSFSQFSIGPVPGAFEYNENISLLSAFKLCGPHFSPEARAIYLKSIEKSLNEDVDSAFILASTRLLEAIECREDCSNAINYLSQHLDKLSRQSGINDLLNYRDSLEYCLFLVNELNENIKQNYRTDWVSVSADNHQDGHKIIQSVEPILDHAIRTLDRFDREDQDRGLNIAIPPLTYLASFGVALKGDSFDLLKANLRPYLQKATTYFEYTASSRPDQINLFQEEIENVKFGPYDLTGFINNFEEFLNKLSPIDTKHCIRNRCKSLNLVKT